jgi:hypothetical protein
MTTGCSNDEKVPAQMLVLACMVHKLVIHNIKQAHMPSITHLLWLKTSI